MKEMRINNKFWVARNELMDLCKKCQSNEKAKCNQIVNRCNKFERKLNHLYYEKLCPFDPCRKCLVRPCCSSECEEYQRYSEVKEVVDLEVRGYSTCFPKGNTSFIAAMKAEAIYPDLRDTLQQYREYVEYTKEKHLVSLF